MEANVHVLMTVYNEEPFLEYAIKSCLPHVRSLTIVEGAYKETIALGYPARSADKTISIAKKFISDSEFNKVKLIHANEKSDAQQRNVGLEFIKKLPDAEKWLLIVDGDEVYNPIDFSLINALTKKMDMAHKKAAYFTSLTFVNDFNHYCVQHFPRLFKVYDHPECKFINDNFMTWANCTWCPQNIIQRTSVRFNHYSFCKGKERFDLKKHWWKTRFGKDFDYSWSINDNNLISDINHKITEDKNAPHPAIMKSHPMWKENGTSR